MRHRRDSQEGAGARQRLRGESSNAPPIGRCFRGRPSSLLPFQASQR